MYYISIYLIKFMCNNKILFVVLTLLLRKYNFSNQMLVFFNSLTTVLNIKIHSVYEKCYMLLYVTTLRNYLLSTYFNGIINLTRT